jgi:chorismate synthase
MSNTFGNKLKITIFGQSHSPAIGVCMDGLPSGFAIDFDGLHRFLQRRAPGNAAYATARREADMPEIISGIVDGKTCGAPLTAIIRNTDTRSSDYDALRDIPRPSHADYTAFVKYGEARDFRGGGQFSGRLTAPLCVAGGICLQLLQREGIFVAAHIAQIAHCFDTPFDPVAVNENELQALLNKDFPVLDEQAGAQIREAITQAKKDGDSVGGVVECGIVGVPPGAGNPMFDRGSENNDAFYMHGDTVRTRTNRHGGILGGISSGMPIVFRTAFKPTPSIAIAQHSVSLSKRENTTLAITGRHDPCIVPRAVPCVEAAAAVALYDILLEG